MRRTSRVWWLRGAGAAALAILGGASSVSAEGLIAQNGLRVDGDSTRIEVFARAGLAGADYFCAAADFARQKLGAGATDRVELAAGLASSRTEPGQRSVMFTLQAPGSGRNTGWDKLILRPNAVGTSRSVAHAQQLCDQQM